LPHLFTRLILVVFLALLPACLGRAAELTQPPFTVHYPPQEEAIARKSLAVLSSAAAELAPRLPLGGEPVEVHIAATEEEFARLAPGAPRHVSGITQSWRSHIVVKAPQLRELGDDYGGTLRHELVHVLLYRNSNTDHMPGWLNEGICMSLANEAHWDQTFQMARMLLTNRLIPYRDLDGALQAPRSSQQFSDAYTQSLSQTRYLRHTLGEEGFWRLVAELREYPFNEALRLQGMTPQDLWQGHRESIRWMGFLGILTSGSFFLPAALLVIIAWFRIRGRNRKTMQRWEAEEADDDDDAVLSWDDVADDPDAWKER
jgi:hypothetical protein